jgi:hypothetical protein
MPKPSDSGAANVTALDYATRTVHAPEQAAQTSDDSEVVNTLRELTDYFGAPAIIAACDHLNITATSASAHSETVLQTLRAFASLIIDSDRPKLTGQLVGKLAQLELATGKRLRLADLARAEGITKQAVSKRLALYAARLNLPRPDSTEAARASHRAMNRRNYGPSHAPPA